MKSTLLILFALVWSIAGFSQAGGEEVTKLNSVMNEQSPSLEEYAEKLAIHKAELAERHVVLKYHAGNKEVDEATNQALARIQTYNLEVHKKVQEFESVWYDLMPRIIAIYTRYGELREATGGGATELDIFVEKHRGYMNLMDEVQTDLDFIDADCGVMKR